MNMKRSGKTKIVLMAVGFLVAAHHGLGDGDSFPKRSPPQGYSAI